MGRPSHRSLALLGIAGLAALVFLWQLGSQYFVDETLTMASADAPLSDLWDNVRLGENNPATYYLLLHLWLDVTGSDAEWVARLPSALACLALVAVVYRLGTLLAGERAGLVAAGLTAISPLVFVHAQQARVYAFAMLFCALTALGFLEAERRRSSRWAIAGAACAAVALSLHYFALLVVGPLCLWALLRAPFPLRRRLVLVAIPAVAWLAWLPLAIDQATDDRQQELGEDGTVTRGHAVRVAGAFLDGRGTTDVGPLEVLGAAVVAGALGWALARGWRGGRRELALFAALAALSAIALAVAAEGGKELFNTRYMTFVAPFMLVVAGAAVARAPAALGAGMLAMLVAVSAVAIVRSQRDEGLYPDTRGVVDAVADDRRPGDVLLHHATLNTWYAVEYYAARRLPGDVPVTSLFDPSAKPLLAARRRIWLVRDEVTDKPTTPLPPGYRTVAVRHFDGQTRLTLLTLEPG